MFSAYPAWTAVPASLRSLASLESGDVTALGAAEIHHRKGRIPEADPQQVVIQR